MVLRGFFLSFFFFLALTYPDQAGSKEIAPEIKGQWQRAYQAYQKGQYDEAEKYLQEILQSLPDFPDAITLSKKVAEKKLAIRLAAEKELVRQREQAHKQVERLLREEARSLPPGTRQKRETQFHYYEEGKRLFQKNDFLGAMDAFQQAIELDPKSSVAGFALKYQQVAQGRLSQAGLPGGKTVTQVQAPTQREIAKEKRQKIAQLVRESWEAQRIKDFDTARAKLQAALEVEPTNHMVRSRLAQIDIAQFRLEKKDLEKEEAVLARERKIDETKMLIDIAKAHRIPETLDIKEQEESEKEKKEQLLEIKNRFKTVVSADFKDVSLQDFIGFLSKSTGANIILAKKIAQEGRKVTIKFKEILLSDALDLLVKSQNLVYRIEPQAIWVTSYEDQNDEPLETRLYFPNKGLGIVPSFTTNDSKSTELGQSASVAEVESIRDIIQEAVSFPSDAKLVLDDRTGALIVTNTPANLQLVEELLDTLDRSPMQVLIEARFIEINVTDLKEIGAELELLGDFALGKSKANASKAKQNYTQVSKGNILNFADFSRAGEGFNLTYQGILSYPQFQAVLHAIEEKETAKTLSAPRVTTLNNQTASIKVVDEFVYPTRHEVELIQFDINGDGDFNDAGETEFANVPKDFVNRDVGIILKVTPSIGNDGKSITLSLSPEVSSSSGNFTFEGGVTIPKFTSRQLQTSVRIQDRETVVMGGLIKETRTLKDTKIPILGSIPFLGVPFRRHTDSIDRRNLMIFVTAALVTSEEQWAKNS